MPHNATIGRVRVQSHVKTKNRVIFVLVLNTMNLPVRVHKTRTEYFLKGVGHMTNFKALSRWF